MNKFMKAAVGNLEMQEIYMGPLFTEIVSNMDLAVGARDLNSTTIPRRAYEFSAADLAISGLLTSLHMFNDTYVPYSSALILELHREGDWDPFIRVWRSLFLLFI